MNSNTPVTENDHQSGDSDSEAEDIFHDARFPADEEAKLLSESHAQKAEANALFASACYSDAISTYDHALASCPNYLDYEIAVLRSNIAACYLKLEDWKTVMDTATACIESLNRCLPASTRPDAVGARGDGQTDAQVAVVELSGQDEEAEQKELECLEQDDKRKEDIRRIRTKALMKRARARVELAGWANLQGAEDDYKELAAMDNLPPQDKKVVQKALEELPQKIQAARENEMGEMMGKLKDLGNGILKPFGLSTDNFKFIKDDNTGGYSMQFQSGS
ncbi:hypothetical protein Egran_03051 [Elaphomyces granulatus]|uniref:Tetratricopeptide repeat protein 1 (TTC1) n=1 Tax=Elaphomyces granulatus TaxID=519963 RepID=A0A232LYL8_9EURO|nr:hypothetical protein Egran_03051 [Elaphomyces granulatus]